MRKIKILLFGLIFLLILTGCGTSYDKDYNGDTGAPSDSDEGSEVVDQEEVAINRKIIYTVNAHISTDNLEETHQSIKNSLQNDEWFDLENLSNDSLYLTIRIKSARLDAFIDSLSNYGEVGNYSREAKDISLTYENHVAKIASLEAERARLNELYLQASIQDMIMINTRISEIILEIGKLNGEIKQFDSLVDYSVVNLRIYEHKLIQEPTFGSQIKNAFLGGFKAVVLFLRYFVIVITAILPFSIIIVPAGAVVYFLVKYNKKKAKDKKKQ